MNEELGENLDKSGFVLYAFIEASNFCAFNPFFIGITNICVGSVSRKEGVASKGVGINKRNILGTPL